MIVESWSLSVDRESTEERYAYGDARSAYCPPQLYTLDVCMLLTREEADRVVAFIRGQGAVIPDARSLPAPEPRRLPGVIDAEFEDP